MFTDSTKLLLELEVEGYLLGARTQEVDAVSQPRHLLRVDGLRLTITESAPPYSVVANGPRSLHLPAAPIRLSFAVDAQICLAHLCYVSRVPSFTDIDRVELAAVDRMAEVMVAQEHLPELVHLCVLKRIDAKLVETRLAQLFLVAALSNFNFLNCPF